MFPVEIRPHLRQDVLHQSIGPCPIGMQHPLPRSPPCCKDFFGQKRFLTWPMTMGNTGEATLQDVLAPDLLPPSTPDF